MKRRSLVLVTVDCLRADHVGFQGYSRPVTPFLDSLAKNSIVISDAIVAGAPTYFSFPAIIASRYPLGLGREVLGIAPGEPTIASAMQDSGYTTAAFLAGNPYLTTRYGYDQGFHVFRDLMDSDMDGEAVASTAKASESLSEFNRRLQALSRRTRVTGAAYDELYFWYCQWRSSRERLSMDQLRRYPAADVLVREACSWLKGQPDAPFFLWLHLMDPHHPYYPPAEALDALGMSRISSGRARLLNSLWNRGDIGPGRLQQYRDEILSLYDAGVLWVDKQISQLVAALQESGRWDKTVFAVTADHGEEFLEHGERYHSPTNLREQLIRVPLLLHAPEISAGKVLPSTFSLIHLSPTLLDAVGVGIPGTFQGWSFWNQIAVGELKSEPAIAECTEGCNNPLRIEERMHPRIMAVRDHDLKLVIHFGEQKDYLYDLKNDAGEHSPLRDGEQTKERVRLLRAAGEHLRQASHSRNVELSVRARLREIVQTIELKREPVHGLKALLDPSRRDKVRVLFLPLVDAGSVNAQSLNVREIAIRLDPDRFRCTLLHEQAPDPRLLDRPAIQLRTLPARCQTLRILREMLAGYDIISYMDYSPASYLFLRLPQALRKHTKAAFHAEAPSAQLVNPSKTLHFLYEGVVPRCDVYTGITPFVARDVHSKTGKKVSHILPVGVDTSLFTPPTARTNSSPVVLFAGTVIERKGPQFMLEAAALFPNAIFRIVGAGREGFDDTLRQKISQLGLKNATLDGPKTQSQLLETMRQSDIFLLPSRLEGIPKVTLEAASTGLPCIVFRDYETPSVVDDVTGFQVGTTEEMMQALGRLIADRSLRDHMGAAARKHMEEFDWDVVSRQWQSAFLEIAAVRVR